MSRGQILLGWGLACIFLTITGMLVFAGKEIALELLASAGFGAFILASLVLAFSDHNRGTDWMGAALTLITAWVGLTFLFSLMAWVGATYPIHP